MNQPIELMLQHAAATAMTITPGQTNSGGSGDGSARRYFHSEPEPNDLLAGPPPTIETTTGTTPLQAGGGGSPATAADTVSTSAAGESSPPSSAGDEPDCRVSPSGACSATAGVEVGIGDEEATPTPAPAAAKRMAELEAELRDARGRAKEAEKLSREKEEANGERSGVVQCAFVCTRSSWELFVYVRPVDVLARNTKIFLHVGAISCRPCI